MKQYTLESRVVLCGCGTGQHHALRGVGLDAIIRRASHSAFDRRRHCDCSSP